MNRERELLGVALDFLDPRRWLDPADQHVLNILTRDIEELLAQPEQAPVAWRYKTHNRYTYTEENYHELEGEGEPLYTSPPKREPLSDDEMRAIWKEGIRGEIPFVEIGRAIEKAHGITGVYDAI